MELGAAMSVLIVLLLRAAPLESITLDQLDDIVRNDIGTLCAKVECLGPVAAETCPPGARWIQGVTMYGCCGGCVTFIQEQDQSATCTGKIDPNSCNEPAGYGSTDCVSVGRQARAPSAGRVTRSSVSRSTTNGSDHNTLESTWCDYGMYCNNDLCQYDQSHVPCVAVQEAYDRDYAADFFVPWRDDFRWRPTCEPDGTYAPTQCKTSLMDETRSCVCVDPGGATLPGKAFNFQEDLYTEMNCLCSVRVYQLEQSGVTDTTLHCLENGNYEPLQCSDGWCHCVHPQNGTIWGYQMPEAAMNYLPCFNLTSLGDQYLRQCESQAHAHATITRDMRLKGVLLTPAAPTTCTRDGAYAGPQCTGSSCQCYSKYNKNCQVSGNLGCDCIRDILTYDEWDRNYDGLQCEILQGDYIKAQQVLSLGAVNTVDKEGTRTSAIVRAACEDNLHAVQLSKCQTLGNNRNSEGQNYCDATCTAGTVQCPDDAYLYSGSYVMNTECIP